MNIFLTDKDPKIAAKHLDDLRLNKMILETAQLLSSAFRELNKDDWNELKYSHVYKKTHFNHPCSIWARKSLDNFTWLVNYFRELDQERYFRTSKRHKSFCLLYQTFEDSLSTTRVKEESILFNFNCSTYKDYEVTDAYKKYLNDKWYNDKKLPKWSNRELPYFLEDRVKDRIIKRV